MDTKHALLCHLLLGLAILLPPVACQQCAGYECLKNYVDKPDSSYRWTDSGERLQEGDGWTG